MFPLYSWFVILHPGPAPAGFLVHPLARLHHQPLTSDPSAASARVGRGPGTPSELDSESQPREIDGPAPSPSTSRTSSQLQQQTPRRPSKPTHTSMRLGTGPPRRTRQQVTEAAVQCWRSEVRLVRRLSVRQPPCWRQRRSAPPQPQSGRVSGEVHEDPATHPRACGPGGGGRCSRILGVLDTSVHGVEEPHPDGLAFPTERCLVDPQWPHAYAAFSRWT
jgi:hypothetical protein